MWRCLAKPLSKLTLVASSNRFVSEASNTVAMSCQQTAVFAAALQLLDLVLNSVYLAGFGHEVCPVKSY